MFHFESSKITFYIACLYGIITLSHTLPTENKEETALKNVSSFEEPYFRHYPIILLAGFGGGQVYSTKANINSDAKHEWLTGKTLLFNGGFTTKFRLLLTKQNTTKNVRDYYFFPGVEETWSIEYLGKLMRIKSYSYYHGLVEALLKVPFYTQELALGGVPYDWRRTLDENKKLHLSVKDLVEKMYNKHNEKVVIVGHSMGGLMTTELMQRFPLEWKEKYIHKAVLVAAPLGGSVKALKGILSGDNFGFPVIRRLGFRRLLSTFPASFAFLPKPSAFGDKNFFSIHDTLHFSAKNLSKYFDMMGDKFGLRMFQLFNGSYKTLPNPEGVQIECIYGNKVETLDHVSFAGKPTCRDDHQLQESECVFDDKPTKAYSDRGDGTVNLDSLRVCRQWQNTKILELNGADHVGILGDPRLHKHIIEISRGKRIN